MFCPEKRARTVSVLKPISNEELQWYCNGRYLGASDRMRPLFLDLLPGQHQVSCMSASGQTAKVDFNVSAS